MHATIERGWAQHEIQNAAYDYQRRVESGEAQTGGTHEGITREA
jgi:methylmalonyl-CoA mutase N-terminal domain/subunit